MTRKNQIFKAFCKICGDIGDIDEDIRQEVVDRLRGTMNRVEQMRMDDEFILDIESDNVDPFKE